MIFHENRLLTDDSHEIPYLIFVENWERCPKICRLLQSSVNIMSLQSGDVRFCSDTSGIYLLRGNYRSSNGTDRSDRESL